MCIVVKEIRKTAGNNQMRIGGDNNSYRNFVSFNFSILDKKIELDVELSKAQSRLSDIVPTARIICQKIIDTVIENAHVKNENIPCCKGCSACCSHYLVPLSVPEVFRLREDISFLPVSMRKSIWKNNVKAAHKILESKPPELFFEQPDVLENNQVDLYSLSNWYSNLNIVCPFLSNDLCSIYEQRPLACREHFIEGSATACSGGHAEATVIDIPIQMPVALGKLASELERTDTEAIILPLALIWSEDNYGRAEKTWPTDMLINRFVEIIQEMADRYSKSSTEHHETVMSS